jgi:integrase
MLIYRAGQGFQSEKGSTSASVSTGSCQIKSQRLFNCTSLRHRFATHLLGERNGPAVPSKLMGPSNSETTEMYPHITQKVQKRLYSLLDFLDIDT